MDSAAFFGVLLFRVFACAAPQPKYTEFAAQSRLRSSAQGLLRLLCAGAFLEMSGKMEKTRSKRIF